MRCADRISCTLRKAFNVDGRELIDDFGTRSCYSKPMSGPELGGWLRERERGVASSVR
ncbi:MAG: hypothetical protein ABJA34_08680 [Pseudonocardiales bacterium]